MTHARKSNGSLEAMDIRRRREVAKAQLARVSRDHNAAAASAHLHVGDAREIGWIPDESVHLAVTSPPYWTLKRYNDRPGQLGHMEDYELFIDELDKVWRHVFRVLVPGGRLVCVVGDVCVARRTHGRHWVMPLHADIIVRCRKIGFDNLNPIIWSKIANARLEVDGTSKFLGKPYEPNAIVKNDIEFILMQRKPGGYRKPTELQRTLSMIDKDRFAMWFQQFWSLTGASTRRHPAPYPEELASRLVRMFSFWGDTVLDPFAGSGTTLVAALKANRNTVGVELDPSYAQDARERLESLADLFVAPRLRFTGFELVTGEQTQQTKGASAFEMRSTNVS